MSCGPLIKDNITTGKRLHVPTVFERPEEPIIIRDIIGQFAGSALNIGHYVIVAALYLPHLHVQPCSSDYIITRYSACGALVPLYHPVWIPCGSL